MYFGRNAYDPTVVSEAQTRLQSFQGATSISSNQYFGRDEEDEGGHPGGDRGTDGGLLGDGSLSGLETAAKEAIAKVLANPDVQNVGESIRSGALKVRADSSGAWIRSQRTLISSHSSRITWRRCPNDNIFLNCPTVSLWFGIMRTVLDDTLVAGRSDAPCAWNWLRIGYALSLFIHAN